jgi:hypothetical protein
MLRRFLSVTVAAVALVSTAQVVSANTDKAAAEAVSEMFDKPHIIDLPVGTELTYTFDRKPSDETKLGKAFSDTISVKIEGDAPEKKKNVRVQMYTGDRARDPQAINGMDGNPMLVVYLDGAVAHFIEVGGGDRAYMKNMFSRQLGTSATVTPVTIDFNGQQVTGKKVSLQPYANDAARAKMRGYEGATFSIVTSDKIPGFFAKMTSSYTNTSKESPTLEETTTLKGVGEIK